MTCPAGKSPPAPAEAVSGALLTAWPESDLPPPKKLSSLFRGKVHAGQNNLPLHDFRRVTRCPARADATSPESADRVAGGRTDPSGHNQTGADASGESPAGPQRSGGGAKRLDSAGAEAIRNPIYPHETRKSRLRNRLLRRESHSQIFHHLLQFFPLLRPYGVLTKNTVLEQPGYRHQVRPHEELRDVVP